MTTPAKLWLRIFAFGFILIVALLAVTLKTPPFYGDLTRAGLLSETGFGWRIDQPHVDPQYLNAAPVSEADVLVIGDSFSMTNRWQASLTRAGYRVSTTFWGDRGVAEKLCDDFDAWLDRAGFHGKLVIIESVERLLADRVASMQTCTTMQNPLNAGLKPFLTPVDQVPAQALNWNGKLLSGVQIYRNMREAVKATAPELFSNRVMVYPVPNGCSMFSSQLCDRMPFWPADIDNGELTVQMAEQMKAFTTAHTKRTILWMIIPNKTTVYVKPEHSKDFVTTLTHEGLGPDLFSFGQEEKAKVRDYFFPNDTHLSMHGQLVLGQRMLEAVRQIFPPPPAKTS